MPLSEADIVQSNSGGYNATATGSASLGAAATAGNTLLIFATSYGGNDFTTVPSGYTEISPTTATTQRMACYRKTAAGGETSATLTMATPQPVAWVMLEVANLDTSADPKDAQSSWTTATAATASTGTSAATSAYDAVCFGVVMARDAASGTAPTWTGHTGGFVELHDQGQPISGGTSAIGMSLACKFVQALGSYEMTATHSLSPTTAPVGGWMVVFAAATSKRAASVAAMDGFERGTLAGATTGVSGSLVYDVVAGSPAIVSTTPRTGSWCLELSASAAAEYVQWGTATLGSSKATLVLRVSVRFPSSLPAGDVELLSFDTDAAGDILVRFRSASSKIGVTVGTGTEQLSAATVAADDWIDLELRATTSNTVVTTADWRLDGVDQTQAVGSAVATGGSWVAFTLGCTTAATYTVHYDDLVISDVPGNYPLGNIGIHPLKVDPAGTITISGTTSNFGVMTANGTIGAWDAANAKAALDDIPPTLGASADAAGPIAGHASDYMEVPLETYNASGTGSIRAVKLYLPMWAASGTAATCRVTGWDGTEAITLFAEADPNADNSSTPAWIAKLWKPTGGWDQTKLNAAAARIGAADATPDLMPHAVLAEVAVQPAVDLPLFGAAGAVPRVEQVTDPVTGGIVALNTWTPAGQALDVTYEVNGTPTSYTAPAGSAPHTQVIDAADMPTVNLIQASFPS